MNTSGVLRINFTADDLGRLRLARATDWMWEVVLSLHLVQSREMRMVFDPWRLHLTSHSSGLCDVVAFLNAVNPRASYFPDFLTPATESGSLCDGLDALRSTAASQFRVQLAEVAKTRALPAEVQALARGDQDAITHLCDAVRVYHEAAIAPFHQCIDARLADVRIGYARTMATCGSEALLRSLGPGYDWRPPVLLTPYPYDFEVHLEGRGLVLIPSFYCVRYPVTVFDRELPPVLVLPVTHHVGWLSGGHRHPLVGGTLSDLLGDTRAKILDLAANSELSTGVIADKLYISAQTVSYHTKILRDAGLIASNRDGASVVHHLTGMGAALVNGRPVAGISSVVERSSRTVGTV